jgi:hypothetical protein
MMLGMYRCKAMENGHEVEYAMIELDGNPTAVLRTEYVRSRFDPPFDSLPTKDEYEIERKLE